MSILLSATIVALILVIGGLIYPLKLSNRSKILLGIIVIVALSKSYIYKIVGGSAYDPNIPYNLSFVFDIARTSVLFLALLVILRAILNFGYKIYTTDKFAQIIPTCSTFYAQLMVFIAFALAVFGTASAYANPKITNYDISLAKLDPRLDGLKIVMLSDVHISNPTNVNLIYDMVNTINKLNPDLILMPGDLVDGPVAKRRPISDLLFKLKATYGVYFSAGNHEYYSDYTQWRQYFEKGNIISLDNRVITLNDGQGKNLLNLAGITDPKAPLYGHAGPDIKGVLKALDNNAPSIMLSHRPQYAHDFAKAKDKHIDLVLSGHTHGGLVKGLDRIVAYYNAGFVSGHYELPSTYNPSSTMISIKGANNQRNNPPITNLIVGNGTMLWMGFPLRLGIPGEIVVINLHSTIKAGDNIYKLTAQGQLERERQLKTLAQDNSNTLKLKAKSKVEANKQYQSLQLVLPLVNKDSGKSVNSITNLLILPPDTTQEQLAKINHIINSPQEIIEEQVKNQTELLQSVTINLIKDSSGDKNKPLAPQDKSPRPTINNDATDIKVNFNLNAPKQDKKNSTNVTISAQNHTKDILNSSISGSEIIIPKRYDQDEPFAFEYGSLDKLEPLLVDNYQINSEKLKDAYLQRLDEAQILNSLDNSIELQTEYAISLFSLIKHKNNEQYLPLIIDDNVEELINP